MNQELRIEPLALHGQALPLLQAWFEAEWPAWYGPGGSGEAASDLASFANRGSLPTGVVAFRDGQLCAVAALKAESIPSHRHLSPWATAGYVDPSMRGQGIGARLLAALEHEAARLGFGRIYCGTSSAQSLLQRRGWQLLERTTHDGKELGIYCKTLEQLPGSPST